MGFLFLFVVSLSFLLRLYYLLFSSELVSCYSDPVGSLVRWSSSPAVFVDFDGLCFGQIEVAVVSATSFVELDNCIC